MIKLRDIFKLPELNHAFIRAGHSGLDRPINWAHVIEHEDMGYYLEGGELLLTSGQIWSDNEKALEQLLKTFLDKQIAGIVFATGRYLKESPKEAIEFGNKYSIPIIEVPFQVSFVKVTRAIHEAILTDRQRSLQTKDFVSDELIKQLKSADSMMEICQIISGKLDSYVLITDPYHRVLTKAIPMGVKHVNESTIIDKLRQTIHLRLDKVEDYQESSLFFEPNQVTFVPSTTPPYTMFVPIHTSDNHFFTLWVINPYHPLEQEDEKVAEYVSFILRDTLSNEKEAISELSNRRFEFMEILLDETNNGEILNEKAIEFGLYNVAYWKVGAIHTRKTMPIERVLAWRDQCQQWLDNTDGISGFAEKNGHTILLLIAIHHQDENLAELFRTLENSLQQKIKDDYTVMVVSHLKEELAAFKEGYDEVKTLIPIVQARKTDHLIYFAEELERELILYGKLTKEQAQALRSMILPEELISKPGDFLYETLKCLAEYGYNREAVAKVMHIHRNTLRYRIKRLEELLNQDLSSPRGRFWIQVALDLETIAAKND